MAGKPKLSVLSDSDEKELSKLSKKKRALAVSGKPDETDRDNLVAIFEAYDKANFGALRKMLEQNKLEVAVSGRGLTNVMTAENLSFSMPQDLQEYIEQYWPTIWTNKEHLRWFLKTFPMFRR